MRRVLAMLAAIFMGLVSIPIVIFGEKLVPLIGKDGAIYAMLAVFFVALVVGGYAFEWWQTRK